MIIIFEDFKEVQSEIEYSVGETVICIDNKNHEKILTIGDEYIVLKIYEIKQKYDDIKEPDIIINYDEYIKKNKDEFYVDVVNKKTYQTATTVYADRFINKLKYIMSKYNI